MPKPKYGLSAIDWYGNGPVKTGGAAAARDATPRTPRTGVIRFKRMVGTPSADKRATTSHGLRARAPRGDATRHPDFEPTLAAVHRHAAAEAQDRRMKGVFRSNAPHCLPDFTTPGYWDASRSRRLTAWIDAQRPHLLVERGPIDAEVKHGPRAIPPVAAGGGSRMRRRSGSRADCRSCGSFVATVRDGCSPDTGSMHCGSGRLEVCSRSASGRASSVTRCPFASTTARSTACSSSRTLPVKRYDSSAERLLGEAEHRTPVMLWVASRNASASGRMSRDRSRSGGISIVTTLMR